MYWLKTRHYDPKVGRFLTQDSLDYLDHENLGGLNLYAYCLNNPISYVDPTGRFAWAVFLTSFVIGILSGFLMEYVPDVIENSKDGFDWSDFLTFGDNWEEYLIAGLEGAVVGAAFGLGAGFGVSAFNAGARIGVMKALTAFGITATGSFAAGVGIYTLETKVFGLNNFSKQGIWKAGLELGATASLSFANGLLFGNQGLYSGKYSLIERIYLKSGIFTTLRMIMQGLFDENF